MRMEYLRYLLEIERHHSISAAAQYLYLSQTTLSATVRRIEEELGFSIFSRTHSGVQATAEGEEALSLIDGSLTRFEEMQMLQHTKTLCVIQVDESVWKRPTREEKQEIKQICDKKP